MEHFTDAQGQFVFPEWLFPDLPASPAVPPSVAGRRDAIEREFALLKAAGIERNYKWAVEVFQFQETWGDLGQLTRGSQIIAQARRIVEKLAVGSTQYAGAANYLLGLLSSSDSGSRVYFRTALKKGYERAWYRVAAKAESRGDKDSAISRFKRGADRGDAACLYTLGLAHLKGLYQLRQNTQQGLHLLEQAVHNSDEDFPRAPYVLGKILIGEGGDVPNGLGLKVDRITLNRERGLDLIQQAALLGFAPALFRMGQARQTKEDGFDCSLALRYVSLAAEQEAYRRFRGRGTQLRGDPETNIVKWLLCGYKDVIRVNEKWAFSFAEIGASEHNGIALFALGYFHEVGVSTNTDPAKAIEYYREGVREGCAAASARLEQMSTNKPNLRRTLTRQDHDAKLRKHRTALINGDGDAGLAAINDHTTLEADHTSQAPPAKVPSPIPEPPQVEAARRVPYPDSPGRSPYHSMTDLTAPQRGPSLSSLSSGPSFRSASSAQSHLPYPTEEQQQAAHPLQQQQQEQQQQPQPQVKQQQVQQQQQLQQRERRQYPEPEPRLLPQGSFHSASGRQQLPYPDVYDPDVPLTFGGALPYPRSPESPRRTAPESESRLAKGVQHMSLKNDRHSDQAGPSYRSFSTGPAVLSQAPSDSSLRLQKSAVPRRGHGAALSMSDVPSSRLPEPAPTLASSGGLGNSTEKDLVLPSDTTYHRASAFSAASSKNSPKKTTKVPNRVPVGAFSDSGAGLPGPAPGTASETTSAHIAPSSSFGSLGTQFSNASATADASSVNATSKFQSKLVSNEKDSARQSSSTLPASLMEQRTESHTVAPVTTAPRKTPGAHTASAPESARSSLNMASWDVPNLPPNLPPSTSDPALNRPLPSINQQPRAQSTQASPASSLRSFVDAPNLATPIDLPARSRHTSVSPSSSLASSPTSKSSPGSPGSPTSQGSPQRRRKARPLSSGWVRDSFIPGASRFFSSSPTLDSGYPDSEVDSQPRQRSPSPLRKMFKSAQDHRSVTDSAVLNKPKGPDPALANVPKVPVQPIKEVREPGVAYTFEDMGVTSVTSAKNDKCVIA